MTAIIVTVGPSSISPKVLCKLKDAGANRFRINLSHSNKESLHEYIDILAKHKILPCIDTQGPQLRVIDSNLHAFTDINSDIDLIFQNENFRESKTK